MDKREIQEKFNLYLKRLEKQPLPDTAFGRVTKLAKELAEGAIEELWEPLVEISSFGDTGFEPYPKNFYITSYLRQRWGGNFPNLLLLQKNGFLDDSYWITEKAYKLIEESELASIFISYKRSESSAFAMYMLTRFKMENLEAFVDMSLVPGEDWHAGLKERIKEYEYLIALLGKETLKSDVCIKEIGWAFEAGLTIIPVWHNGFKYKSSEWKLPSKIDNLLANTHSIEVKEESASGYNTAMVELLNVFGITP